METKKIIINYLVSLGLEKLLELWESTTEETMTFEVAKMRDLLMDAIEAINPLGFNAWIDNTIATDKELRFYVLKK